MEKFQTWGLRFLPYLVVFVWPFVFCLPLVVVINGKYSPIGNDFTILYYTYKVYFLNLLSTGHFPLWSPAEASGFPFFANPFAQTLYPLNLPLLLFYKATGGYSSLNHQQFTIFGVAIFAVGLFIWLKQFRLSQRAILFSSLLVPVSFKVMDILRFPNAVHTAAWYPWILFTVTRLALSTSKKQSVLYSILLMFFAFCFLTGGYLYFNYYGIFLFGPYLLILLIPALRKKIFGDDTIHIRIFMVSLIGAGSIVLFLCAPYLIYVMRLMSSTVDRGGNNFAYSTEYVFGFRDTIGSFIFPPISQTEGWNYFGILGVLLIVLYFFHRLYLSGYAKQSVNHINEETAWYLSPIVKFIFLIWIIVISYISYGNGSALFIFLWHYMPGFASLRVWGRLNIILVPILGLLLGISFNNFENILARKLQNVSKTKLITVLFLTFSTILILQLWLLRAKEYNYYWLHALGNVAGMEPYFITASCFSFICLLVFLILKYPPSRTRVVIFTAFCLITGLAVIDEHGARPGSWMWINDSQPQSFSSELDINAFNMASFSTKRINETWTTLPINGDFSIGIVPNWYFSRYATFLNNTKDEEGARNILLGVTTPGKVFFSSQINYNKIQAFLDDSNQFQNNSHYTITSYTGDELILDVQISSNCYLSFIDNWAEGWNAVVDDYPVQIELLFGTFKSIPLTSGRHRIKFYYSPDLR